MNRRSRSRRQAKGIALIEALVGILILAIGILGIFGLQVSMTRAQTSGKFRSDAAYLASELVGSMWGDFPNLNQYTTGNCAAHPRCADWQAKVGNVLPGGIVKQLLTDANGNVTITIDWTVPGEGTHEYTTVTSVQ